MAHAKASISVVVVPGLKLAKGDRVLINFRPDFDLDGGQVTHTLGLLRERFPDVALTMIGKLPDDPELIEGLRHLRDAKDCFVRANVARLEGGFDG